jgi:hypothetical protein
VIADSVITANSITNTNIDIYDNIIVTTVSNSDLELSANGTGRIYVSTNDVEIENDLTVNTDSDLNSVFILGTIYQTGNSNRTGNSTQTGSTDISQTLDVDQTAYFEEITILENKIYTNTLDTDLELVANGTGVILLSKPVAIDQELSVLGTTYTSAISNSNTITSDQFFNNDISITDNVLTTTISNSDLVLSASGNLINIQNSNIQLTQNLDVNGTSTLLTTDVTGLIQQTGNTVRTGSVNLTGNISVTNLTVTNGIQFENIDFDNNVITTTVTNDDLQLEANGTGRIYIPTNNVEVDQNLTVNTILYTENINNDQEISSDKFLTNKIEIRNDYIETTSTDNLRFLASNNVVVEDVTFDSNRIRTNTLNSNLEITPGTDKNLILNSNKSLLVARGTTANKLTLETGDLRFNTSDNLFEGFSTGRRTIGGVYSANRNTFINLNSLTNTITFTIGAAAVLDITENRLRTDELRIDNLISLNDNTISNNTGTDLLLTPNGTGSIVAGSWSFTDNDISNNSLTDKLTFVSSADGYLKFHGDAIGIPSGTSSERPLSPDVGDIRLNTEDEQVEVFNGASYNPITGTGEVATEELVRELGDLWTLVLG